MTLRPTRTNGTTGSARTRRRISVNREGQEHDDADEPSLSAADYSKAATAVAQAQMDRERAGRNVHEHAAPQPPVIEHDQKAESRWFSWVRLLLGLPSITHRDE